MKNLTSVNIFQKTLKTAQKSTLLYQYKAFCLGFTFGHDNLTLIKVPQYGKLTLSQEDLDEVLYILSEDEHTVSLSANYQFTRVRSMLASKACRSAIMIGTALNHHQMENVILHMSNMDQPWNCPHGRPTMRHLINMQLLMT